jgi:nicotinate-nucleotide--dimethylbenzimidazole phosphoribosyltransferase
MEPAAAAHLIAGQRSREAGHAAVLAALGLEPLLDVRLRAGEGVGASLAVGLLRAALAVRLSSARTAGR